MKKKIILTIIGAMAFLLAGCDKVMDINEDQKNMVAQGAAAVLLRHSYDFMGRYPKQTETEKEPETTVPGETTSQGETQSPSEGPTEKPTEEPTTAPDRHFKNVMESFGYEMLTLEYSSYKTAHEYPDDEDAMFTFSADEGYDFLIVTFKLTNPTTQSVSVTTRGQDHRDTFALSVNDGEMYNNYGNMMLNDLTNLKDVNINPGESTDVILIFMVNTKDLENIKTMTLQHNKDASKVIIKQ